MAPRLPGTPRSAVATPATCGQGTHRHGNCNHTVNARQEVLRLTAERPGRDPSAPLGELRRVAPGPAVPPRRGSSYSTHRCGRGRASGDRLLHERCPVSVTKDPPGPRHCAPQGSSSCLRLGFPGSRRELTCGRRLCLDGWTWAGVGQEGSDGVLLGNVAGHASQDTRDLSGCTGERQNSEKKLILKSRVSGRTGPQQEARGSVTRRPSPASEKGHGLRRGLPAGLEGKHARRPHAVGPSSLRSPSGVESIQVPTGKAGVRKLRTGSARTETTCRSPADIGHPSLPLACRRPGRVT